MIVKLFNLTKDLNKKINFFLLYGKNVGHIEDTINNVLKPNFSKNVFYYEETDILNNTEQFEESILNSSFFENDKLIIISRASDKLLKHIEEIIEKKPNNLKIIIKSGALDKKSKLRSFFEKSTCAITVPFYEDESKTLITIAHTFFKKNKIKINQENINFIVGKCKGSRITLKNELEKIANFSQKKLSIDLDEIIKLTNSAENYNISELTDSCLAKNKRKTINILNENNSTAEDSVLILKSFLFKLKRLKKLKEGLNITKNQDQVLNSYKPPIFWKDKEIIKLQLKNLSLNEINEFIEKINDLELSIKQNSQISTLLINNFILKKLELSSNVV